MPGSVEIDLVGHEGGSAVGDHCYTLTVTDIATGWTENRGVPNRARRWVIEALEEIALIMPFPVPRRRESDQEVRHRHHPHRRAERHDAVSA